MGYSPWGRKELDKTNHTGVDLFSSKDFGFTLHRMGRVLCRETGCSVLGFNRTTQEIVMILGLGGRTS